ncbi:hypothetical protein IMZ48_45280 [Candidatus Bathyarchaeota archaeon]|nr:hypothetical protein [Candidatus Bathyarchaeota archaeon]
MRKIGDFRAWWVNSGRNISRTYRNYPEFKGWTDPTDWDGTGEPVEGDSPGWSDADFDTAWDICGSCTGRFAESRLQIFVSRSTKLSFRKYAPEMLILVGDLLKAVGSGEADLVDVEDGEQEDHAE